MAKLVQRRADALRQEPNAWDALACARQDATADAPHLELRLPSAGDAEKLAGRARDDRARDGMFPRLELRAVPEAEPDARVLCTQAAARFAERSCAAPVEEARQVLWQWAALAKRWPMLRESLAQVQSLAALAQHAAVQLRAYMYPAMMLPAPRLPSWRERPAAQMVSLAARAEQLSSLPAALLEQAQQLRAARKQVFPPQELAQAIGLEAALVLAAAQRAELPLLSAA